MPTRPPFAIQNRDSVAVFGEKKKYLVKTNLFSLFYYLRLPQNYFYKLDTHRRNVYYM